MDSRKDEEAAADLTAAMSADLPPAGERMRAALAARVIADGEAMIRMGREGELARPIAIVQQTSAQTNAQTNARTDVRTDVRDTAPVKSRADLWRWTGWMAAAAAVLLWAIGPRDGGADRTPGPDAAPATVTAAAETPAELRARVLQGDRTVVPISWAATSDSTAHGATGDVVWSDRLQQGVLRIAGLQPNDRERWQYQLWIFDKTRDEKYPVDGGVFDIASEDGEVLVPIAARLRVGNAVVFAVTVERAGGVVVSARDRIALLAQRGG
ncbi:MAG: anti-sigma factor [Gemmatimonadota bacterium]